MSRAADEFIATHPELLTEDRTSARFCRLLAVAMAPAELYFRFRVEGWENVPEGACLVVANHSTGAAFEIPLLLRAWRRRFGDRRVRGLAHRIAWQWPMKLLPLAQKMGGIFAHPAVARAALERGDAVLVFPGGDVDTCRPFSDRYRVFFDGRSGFARIAREARAPIVPLAICGSHALYVSLPGGRLLARWTPLGRVFGLKAFFWTPGMALSALALVATIVSPSLWPYLIGAIVFMLFPFPSRIEARFLAPVVPREGETDEALAERARAAVEAGVGDLARGRLTPWF